MTHVVPEVLLDRDGELAEITDVIDGVRDGRGRLVVVEGPAGIGKTVLLGVAREAAVARGLRVLSARGAELETAFGFGVVRQLFEHEVEPGALDGRPAASLVGGAPTDLAALGDEATLVVTHDLYHLSLELARERPLALIVDDAHWADMASSRFLLYLGSRLAGRPVAVVVATRAAGNLARLPDAHAVRLRPLGADAVRHMVRAALPDADDPLCAACADVTGGNPFFLRELTGILRSHGARTAKDAVDLVPRNVSEAVAARTGRLPEAARNLAHATAVLGSGALLRHAAALSGLGATPAAQAADVLVTAGLVEPRLPLEFVHPIIRSALHQDLPPGKRAAAHAHAARLLAGDGAVPERIAAHLCEAEPDGDSWACDWLERAARVALQQGAPDSAIAVLRRALAEPPAPRDRGRVLTALGTAEMLALDHEAAIDHLSQGLAEASDPDERLRAALTLGRLLTAADRPSEATTVLEAALDESDRADPALTGQVEAQLVNNARTDPTCRRRLDPVAARIRRRVDRGEPAGPAELAAVAADMAMAGESAQRTAELSGRVIELLRDAPPAAWVFEGFYATRCLIFSDGLDEAREALERLLARVDAEQSAWTAVAVHAYLAEVRLMSGDLAGAEADARTALAGAGGGWEVARLAMASALVRVFLEQNRHEAAMRVLAEVGVTASVDELPELYPATLALYARGLLRLADGDTAAAVEDLLACGRRLVEHGETNPAFVPWRSGAARGLLRLGDRSGAQALADEELVLARRFGAPRAIAVALRARAAVGGGLANLQEAAAILETSPARLEAAHVHGDLGAALLAAGRPDEGIDALRRAVDLAHRCGATVCERAAMRELRRAGVRPRRTARIGPDALTSSERRVAELAAAGLPNTAIAAELVVVVRTVEFHLTGAYRKLGVGTRDELAAVLDR